MAREPALVLTRERTWLLTGASVLLFVLLCWVFADGLLGPPFWNAADWSSSSVVTYLLLAAIVAAGALQARGLPATGRALAPTARPPSPGQVEDPTAWRLLTGNVALALFWLPIRFFVGREWFTAGLHKVGDPAWIGGGEALRGYWERAVAVPEAGGPPITYDWFRQFLQFMLDNAWHPWFAWIVAWGEVLVGLGLLVGALVGIAAFFGTVLNFSFLLAGTTSTNPVLFGLAIFLVLAWKVAGFWGADRWLLPLLGTPWQHGTLLTGHRTPEERASGRLGTGHG